MSLQTVDGAMQKLRNLGVPERHIEEVRTKGISTRTIDWISPADGVVIEKKIVNGQRLMPGDELYRIADLSEDDIEGLRHLYYQRVFITLADRVGIVPKIRRRPLTLPELESLRCDIVQALVADPARLEAISTLWGWNFGYDFSASGYRLHASHQMIHQQYAMVPEWVEDTAGGRNPAFCCGDQLGQVTCGWDCHRGYIRTRGERRHRHRVRRL